MLEKGGCGGKPHLKEGAGGGTVPSLGNFRGYITCVPTQNPTWSQRVPLGCLAISANNEVQIHTKHIKIYRKNILLTP